MFTTSKVVIINEDYQCPFLIDLIQNHKPNHLNQQFQYLKYQSSEKTINLFELSEVPIIKRDIIN